MPIKSFWVLKKIYYTSQNAPPAHKMGDMKDYWFGVGSWVQKGSEAGLGYDAINYMLGHDIQKTLQC